MGTAQIPGSSNPVRANWRQSKTFFGFNSGAASLTFFFHLFPFPPFFLLILFLSFSLAFVHRVHFYGKVLGKTFRIIELAELKIFKLKIFIETFGSTLLSVFLWPVWLNHAHSGCFSLHKFDVKVLYDCLNWWQLFLVCKVLKYLSKVVLHTCRAKIVFGWWPDTITGKRNFCSVISFFGLVKNLEKRWTNPCVIESVNIIVFLQRDKI